MWRPGDRSYEILAKWKQKWTGGLLSQTPPVCVGLWIQDKATGILWKLGVMSFPYEIMEKSERREFLMSSDKKQNKMYNKSNSLFQKQNDDDGGKARRQDKRREWVAVWSKNNCNVVKS